MNRIARFKAATSNSLSSNGRGQALDALAEKACMSRLNIAERFDALTGQPPMKSLTGWRMQLAQRRLVKDRLTAADVAAQCETRTVAAAG